MPPAGAVPEVRAVLPGTPDATATAPTEAIVTVGLSPAAVAVTGPAAGAAGIAGLDRAGPPDASAGPSAAAERSAGASPQAATFAPATAAEAAMGDGATGRAQPDTARPDTEAEAPLSLPSDANMAPVPQAADLPVSAAAPTASASAEVAAGSVRGSDAGATALLPAAGGARVAQGTVARDAGAVRGRGGAREGGAADAASAAAGYSGTPIEDGHGAREQGGSLFAEGEAPSAEAVTFLGLVLPAGHAAFPADAALANPLWAWALGGVLGGEGGPALWQRLGMSPAALASALREAPWAVAGGQLGRTVGRADLMALQTLPGPLAALLGVGVAPEVALAVQLGWEAALLGGPDPVTGRDLPPLWEDWGLEAPGTLAALAGMAGAGRDADALGGAGAERPSGVASLLLGLPTAVGAVPGAVRAAMAALPAAALLGPGGLGGLRLVPVGTEQAGPALSGLAAVRGALGGAVLIGREGGGGLSMPGDAELILGGGLTLASGLAGQSPCVLASWQGGQEAGGNAGSLAALVLEILPAAPSAIAGAEWTLPLGGPLGAQGGWGEARMADGCVVRVGEDAWGCPPGTPAPAGLRTGAPRRAPPRDWLRLCGRRGTDHGPGEAGRPGFDAHAVHGEQRPVAIDLAPVRPVTPCWRLDDTRTLVEIGPAGMQAATLRASALHRALLHGVPSLDMLKPGEGLATWAGSPLWLGLAGIVKPTDLGVALGETVPGRVEVLHLRDGAWHVEHSGGAARAPCRLLYPPDAAESPALLLGVLYGVPGEVRGTDGRRALAGFEAARARTADARAGWDMPARGERDVAQAERMLRERESWAAVARDWGQAVSALEDAPSTASSAGGALADGLVLRDQVVQGRAIAVVWAMQEAPGGMDALAALCGEHGDPTLAEGVAAALVLCAVTGTGGAARGTGTAATPSRDGGPSARHSALWQRGAGVLARVSEGLIEGVSRHDGLALAARLDRLAAS